MQWQDVDCIEISSESEPEPPKTLDELFNECTDEFNVASRRLDEAMITALLPPSYRSNSHIEPRTSSFGARNMNNGHITRKLTPEQLHDNLVFPHRNGKLNKPLSSMKFTQGTDFRSHSKYESNLPTSSVILDSPTNESVSFLPYADKSGSYRSAIDDLLYTDLHDGILHWSNEAYHSFENDVDNERVLIECASRARDSGLEIPMDTVPWTLLEKADQRHLNVWSSSSLASPVTDQVTSLTNGVRYFCWNINCLCGCCLSHKLPRQPSPTTHSPSPHDDSRAGTHRSVAQETNDPTTNPHLKTAFYERTQAQMLDFDYRRSTCVTPCCLPAKPLPIQNDGSWGQEDEEYLKMLLLSNPDMRPCPASMVTKVPCARVFDIRGEMIQEQQLVPKPTILAKRRKQAQRAGYKPTKKTILARTGPCRHEGPCDGSVSCSCYKNGHYCQRGCGCAGSCMRSWRPCRCTGESKRIKELKNTEESEKTNDRCSGKCPCKKADRECDPLMCTCGARQSGSLRDTKGRSTAVCQNTGLHTKTWKRTIVKESTISHGLGLFADEDIEPCELVLEYTGLLQNQDTPTYRLSEYYNTERGRNYTFDTVDPDFVPHLNTSEDRPMDSAHIGNHSKFANHKPPKGRNVIAGLVLTNGDIRIGYYAAKKIQKGKELFLDYGADFFKDETANSEDAYGGTELGNTQDWNLIQALDPDPSRTESTTESNPAPSEMEALSRGLQHAMITS